MNDIADIAGSRPDPPEREEEAANPKSTLGFLFHFSAASFFGMCSLVDMCIILACGAVLLSSVGQLTTVRPIFVGETQSFPCLSGLSLLQYGVW